MRAKLGAKDVTYCRSLAHILTNTPLKKVYVFMTYANKCATFCFNYTHNSKSNILQINYRNSQPKHIISIIFYDKLTPCFVKNTIHSNVTET